MPVSLLRGLVLLAAYLVAAIPFGVLLGRVGGVDVRRVGSGNIGATNVLRHRGILAGIATLLLDAAKGAAGVALALAMDKLLSVDFPDSGLLDSRSRCQKSLWAVSPSMSSRRFARAS